MLIKCQHNCAGLSLMLFPGVQNKLGVGPHLYTLMHKIVQTKAEFAHSSGQHNN